ncbi:MAG: RP853 family protein [Rickettsiaceae bacterium]
MKVYLDTNLSNQLITSLSNMLAIDYVNRLKEKPKIDEYAVKCVDKLKNHLNHKVFTEEGFSGVMTLFAIAITDEKRIDDELINTQEKDQDVIVDTIISSQFGDLSPAEQLNIKEVLKSLVTGRDSKEIMNFIDSNPKLFYSVVLSAHKEKSKQKEIMEIVIINLHKIIANTKSINKKKNNIKSLTGKIVMAAGLVAVASAGAFLGGLIIPAIIIPSVAVSIKLGASIGEKIGETIAQNNRSIKNKQSVIKAFEASIMQPVLDQNIPQSKYQQQKKHVKLQPKSVDIKPKINNVLDQNRSKSTSKKNSRQR